MPTPENRNFSPEQSPQDIQRIFDNARPALEIRLDQLKENPYHNRRHAEEVVDRMQRLLNNLVDGVEISETDKKLLIECAWRHDDGHSGHSFRQEAIDTHTSNEEHAVELLKKDLQGKLSEEHIAFMEAHILATSFGQSDKEALKKEGKGAYYREYKPETDSQKLLALADVSGFTEGWDKWVMDSMFLKDEAGEGGPYDLVNERIGFAKYIAHMLNETKELLKPDYATKLRDALKEINSHLDILLKQKTDWESKNKDKV